MHVYVLTYIKICKKSEIYNDTNQKLSTFVFHIICIGMNQYTNVHIYTYI